MATLWFLMEYSFVIQYQARMYFILRIIIIRNDTGICNINPSVYAPRWDMRLLNTRAGADIACHCNFVSIMPVMFSKLFWRTSQLFETARTEGAEIYSLYFWWRYLYPNPCLVRFALLLWRGLWPGVRYILASCCCTDIWKIITPIILLLQYIISKEYQRHGTCPCRGTCDSVRSD